MRKLSIYMIIILLAIISCDDLELIDTSAPSIEVEKPLKGDYFHAGKHAIFHAKFVDDFELATFNIEIHENFSEHSHGRITAMDQDPSLIKWAFKQSFLIPEGLTLYQAILEEEIKVPSNALAGPFHYIVQAIDKEGNSTSFQNDSAVELEVYITNDSQPMINITNLIEDELEIEVGVRFMVEGDVSDPTIEDYAGMHSLGVVLGAGLSDNQDHSHGGRIAKVDLIDFHFEEQELIQFMIDGDIILEKVFEYIEFTLSQAHMEDLIAEEIDHLQLTIRVIDEQGNIAVSNTDVHVHLD